MPHPLHARARRRWEWWTLWFEFALLLAFFVAAFQEHAFARGRAVFLAYFTLATACLLLSAHNYLTQARARVQRARGLDCPAAGMRPG